jgi:hypothetical protein
MAALHREGNLSRFCIDDLNSHTLDERSISRDFCIDDQNLRVDFDHLWLNLVGNGVNVGRTRCRQENGDHGYFCRPFETNICKQTTESIVTLAEAVAQFQQKSALRTLEKWPILRA